MKLMLVVGARPNYMKVAPIADAAAARVEAGIETLIVHTGQHYDRAMSELFFEELGMPAPDVNLGVGSGSHAQQTARIMETFEPVLVEHRPDLLVVVGDVNSTLACAIDAKKLGIPVAHVEAGLRSGDMTMPEEINRIVTDSICDLFFTTDRLAGANLEASGAAPGAIHFVGNVMIDTLLKHRAKALERPTLAGLGLRAPDGTAHRYALATLHRPGNVDDPVILRGIGEALSHIGRRMPVLFPVHPRSRARIEAFGLGELFRPEAGVRLIEPQGYLDFINLTAGARMVLTDSGGIQEETTILGVPCLTLRPNTERPITTTEGTNRLVGNRRDAIVAAADAVLAADPGTARPPVPELWDGRSAERIVDVLVAWRAAHAAVTAEPPAVSGATA